MNQSSAPLFEELLRFSQSIHGNYFVPGHKQGMAFDTEGLTSFSTLLKLDLTEVGDLDDLHQASGVIDQAQRLAADAFFAEKTFFLVGGTTAGNLATLLAACRPGDEVIVQRSCHQSVFNGCSLAGAKPITLPVDIDPYSGIEATIQPDQLEVLLEQYPSVKSVVVTSPTYFGRIQPLQELAEICHAYNIPLIVDEAHGAHLGFHPSLPLSAMQCGADIATQSTHKLLTSMTMSSMLHVQGNRIDLNELTQALRIIQSSSPSYPLLASLDLARRYVVTQGEIKIDESLSCLKELRQKISALHHLQEAVFSPMQDPFKMVLQAKNYSVTGYAMQRWLESKGHYVELADANKMLLVFSLGMSLEQCESLYVCLRELDQQIPDMPRVDKLNHQISIEYGQPLLSWDKVRMMRKVEVSIHQAVGSIVAEMVTPYPPGIPFLLPGEVMTKEKQQSVLELLQAGCSIRGINTSSSPSLCVLQ